MRRGLLFWILAFIITVASAYYQRITGPTYPVEGSVKFGNEIIKYKLDRSHSGSDAHKVKIKTVTPGVKGILKWKRYKTDDELINVRMEYDGDFLVGELPGQPPAGKLQYQVALMNEKSVVTIPEDEPVVIRFKGDVPLFILIPHIIFIFTAMLLSTRTGFEIFNKEPKLKSYTIWTTIILVLGGIIFGPITQLYAFGELWTGFPFGIDLTDNKTLIALIGWLVALIAVYKFKKPKAWVLGASILMFVIFLIPHSVLGSELDYNKLDNSASQIENMNP